jgi:hypothetical protein
MGILLTLLEYFTNKQKEKTMNITVNIILLNDGYAIVINDKTIPIHRRRLPPSLLLEVEKEGIIEIKERWCYRRSMFCFTLSSDNIIIIDGDDIYLDSDWIGDLI